MRPVRVLLLISCLSCHKYARPVPELERPAGEESYAFSGKAQIARLVKVFFDLPQGYLYGEMRSGFDGLCTSRSMDFTNFQGPHERDVNDFADVFSRVLAQHGYPVEEETGVFAQPGHAVAGVLVAARVVEESFNKCYPNVGVRNERTIGAAYLKIEWSLYSTLEKKVILTRTSEGTTYGEMESEVGEVGILRQAFSDATERLARDPAYRLAIDPAAAATAQRNRIRIRRVPESSGDLELNLAATRASVVGVIGDGKPGSGFVFAAPGWILSSAQVVGNARIVKLTLANGSSCYGEVTASSRARDLALIESRCAPLKPLPLAQGQITGRGRLSLTRPGSAGAPASLDSGTGKGMTTILGMTWVKSDVKVRPGDAGGPLLDIHGNVVAVISGAVTAEAAREGLDLSVPAGDVAKYLPIDFE